MANSAGLWIDHRKAVIVTVAAEGEHVQEIESNASGHVRYAGGPMAEPEDRRDRHIMKELNDYYDAVIDSIRDAEWIYVFGPGEGKTQFAQRLEHRGLTGHLDGVDTAGEMTNPQIAAQVREHFANAQHPKHSRPHKNAGH
jgi:hypothetical protein